MLEFGVRDYEYTMDEIVEMIALAGKQGHPVIPASYLESLTLKQVDNLTKGIYDA